MPRNIVFYKAVDQSVLTEGFTIPLLYKEQLFSGLGFKLERGQKRPISVWIDGAKYSALMTNIQFNKQKYPNHGDLIQIRYSTKSPIVTKLREIFALTDAQITEQKMITGNGRLTSISEDKKEFLSVYSTPVEGELLFECIPNTEFREETAELAALGEKAAEGLLDGTDETAGLCLKTKVCKVRHLTKTISQDLKIAYGYRCQICGQYVGEPYGSKLIHAHHIDYFVKSLNNNANNIMILCPNHHGIIHDQNPEFDFSNKTFHYPNGYIEGLKLNFHLK
ncbi:MAG: HNH endonuclease signature motif containing protein [Firmicutes bacterium]|nr:HNH endonuclease signature motif containing protein [Bacillota bacterium]